MEPDYFFAPFAKAAQCQSCRNIIPKPEPLCPVCGGMLWDEIEAREVYIMEKISPYLCEPVFDHFEIKKEV